MVVDLVLHLARRPHGRLGCVSRAVFVTFAGLAGWASAYSHGAEVQPGSDVPPFQWNRIIPAEGERCFVIPQIPYDPTADEIPQPPKIEPVLGADGSLYWVGEPGLYLILAFGDFSQSQQYVRIRRPPGPTPPPNPNPQPDPTPNPTPTPSGFAEEIRAALESIGNPASKAKVAAAYSEIAEEANVRRDLWKPALMVDEVRQRVVSKLTPNELSVWAPFWPQFNEAVRNLKLEESDTDGFIRTFREFDGILQE